MINQEVITNIIDSSQITTVLMLILMIFLMSIIFSKYQIFLLALVVELFSLLFGVYSLNIPIPLAPFFQIFFLVYQSTLFFLISSKAYKYKRNGFYDKSD